MHTDICFPSNNEEEFIRIACTLKLKGLCFIYPSGENISEIKKRQKNISLKVTYATNIRSEKDLSISKNSDFLVSDSLERQFIESKRIMLHYGLEPFERKDSLQYRKSGITQIASKIFFEKNKIYGLSHSLILNARDKPILFGRMLQNVRILQKYKCNIFIGSFAKSPYELRSRNELISFGVCLGIEHNAAKACTLALEDFFLKKEY